ncbi:HK97 family phage prohead protease [Bradyrhizobium barranii subsp. barranii]|uniref:HK97 family phage prohead protease n=1 Tax=Bradyrhizobium barranii subsp. barranii TaxID=2823807 RepID=A0A7Z0TS11_9BRAD|nr:HK97 family phage prohead protease [Bradyrhizobium barranii]UGX97105.1 HK97 family phage prohead protease [Bradyrhizobium barranii subsp. barranii]
MTIVIDPADLRSLERSEERAFRVDRGGAFNAILDLVDGQALDGQAIKFDVTFPYRGDLIMLRAGCFGDASNTRVGLWVDHDGAFEVASTDDAVELVIDDESVQFRLDLGSCKLGPVIARMCQSDNRSSVSVGADILAEHKETIGGERVRVVTRAKLKEISIVKEGAAGENAFAMVVDKTVTPKPVAGSRSMFFNASRTLSKVSRTVRKLKASLATTYGDREQRRPTRWPTLEESNRAQTAETERLQKQARASLFK